MECSILGVLRYARGVHQQRAARLVEVLGLVLRAGLILQHEDVVAHLRHVLRESWSPRAPLARGAQCVIHLLYPAPLGVVRYVARREQVVDQQVGLSLFGHGELWFGIAGLCGFSTCKGSIFFVKRGNAEEACAYCRIRRSLAKRAGTRCARHRPYVWVILNDNRREYYFQVFGDYYTIHFQ